MPEGRAKDLEMVRGDTPKWGLGFSRGIGPLPLPPGTLIWMTAKRDLTDDDVAAVFKKGIGTGVTITDATNGRAEVQLVALDTTALSDADHVLEYDVQVKELGGGITSFRGRLTVKCDITVGVV